MGVQHLKFHILGKPSALWKLGCFTHILHPLLCFCSLGLLPSSVPSYHALKTSQDCPHPTLPSCHHGHDFAEVSCRWRALFLHSIRGTAHGESRKEGDSVSTMEAVTGAGRVVALVPGSWCRVPDVLQGSHHVPAWTSGRNCGLTLLCMIPNPWDIAGSFWSFQVGLTT